MAVMAISSTKVADVALQSQRVQYASKICKVLAWAISLAGIPMVIALRLFFLHADQLLIIAASLLLMAVAAWLYPTFLQRDKGPLGITLLLGLILMGTMITPLLIPVLMPAALVGQIAVILLAELLLGERGGRWMLGASVVVLAATYVVGTAWPSDWTIPLDETVNRLVGGPINVFGLLVATAIVRQATRGQEKSFRQEQQAKLELEKVANLEKTQRQRLQSIVDQYVAYMAEVSRGNLGARLHLEETDGQDDPLITLGQNLSETVGSLHAISLQVHNSAANLGSAAAEILAATSQQVQGATEQSAAVTQSSTTIDQVRSSAEQTAQYARSVEELAQRTTTISQTGQQSVAQTIEAMNRTKQKVDTIAHNVLALSEQAQAIGEIIAAVKQIATQSHMLALNASVEAARAGEAGKGFAVVAEEVRALAKQSREATEQVRMLLTEIQAGVNTAVMATEDGMKEADRGSSLAGEAGLAILQLANSVAESNQAAKQIAVAVRQQLAGMDQIVQAMRNIDQATVQSLAGSRQTEGAAVELTTLAGEMQTLVEQYLV